jgi:hypothetical protein
VRAKVAARRKETRKKLLGMGVVALVVIGALVAFILY